MAVGDADIVAKQQQQQVMSENNKMNHHHSSSSSHDKHQHHAAPAKRRLRGNFYGKHLWGPDPSASGELEYVQRHGDELIHKMLTGDENWKYVSLKQVHDVRLYTPIATPEDDAHVSESSSRGAPALDASSAGRSLSSTSASSAKDRPSATRILPGRCDFRAMTRVAGSIDTVMEILAADEDREAYWTALNTQKGLRAHNMFGSRRLVADAPFPRWSQRYMATRFTKYSTKSVDVCFAEYATLTPVTKAGEPRRGFIYRRSVDEGLFEMDAIKARLAKYDDECERMYIQDWLYEVSETQERDVCKVVLTCSVYFSGDYSRSLRTEFHEFTTDILVQLRKVLSKHWQEQQGEVPEDASGFSATNLLNNAFKIVKPGQSRYCSVCSAKFSLLRKRHTCRTCCASVCSKCSLVAKPKGSSILGQVVAPDASSNGSTRECTLCHQFSDETTDSRSSASVARNFVAPLSPSLSATQHEDDDDSDSIGSASLTSSSRSILSDRDARKLFSSSASATMKARTHAAPAPSSTSSSRGTGPRKARHGSSDSTTSSKSVPEAGVVLFSDLDALTLSGRVVGPASSSRTKRPIRTVSEDNVLHARDSVREDDDLANFNLKLL